MTEDGRFKLAQHTDCHIHRHTKVQNVRSPYDGDLVVRIEAARESGRLKDSPGKRSNASVHFLGASGAILVSHS